MKTISLPFKPVQIIPSAPILWVGAQVFGYSPENGIIIQLVLFALAVAGLMIVKRQSFSFALQSVTGFASHRQNEILKKHVPTPIRKQIESGNFNFEKQTVVTNAAVGFVDIVASSRISNRIGLECDFELKKAFLQSANMRSQKRGITILNHTGDGFLFMINPAFSPKWKKDLVSFYIELTSDFRTIVEGINSRSGQFIRSGLKFGVSYGSVMTGCLGSSPTQYTAVGPEVNLAARLCANAEANEIVFSESAWQQLRVSVSGFSQNYQMYELKGFDGLTTGVHVSRESSEVSI